jgi:hypothetical protein
LSHAESEGEKGKVWMAALLRKFETLKPREYEVDNSSDIDDY